MSDLIYRQAAIDALADYIHNVDRVLGTGHLTIPECKGAATFVLSIVPYAQPEKVCIAKTTLSEEQVREAVEKAKSEIVQVLPSAEPEIVRCKDCINYTRGKDEWGSCFENPMMLWRETDYCSWAERRTDAEIH